MRLRNIPGADDAIASSEYCIQEPKLLRGSWQSAFPLSQPIHIEIGMGKGRFLMDMAAELSRRLAYEEWPEEGD